MRFFLLIYCVLFPLPAFAYIGPGPLFGMMGSALAIVSAIILSLVVVVTYPLRRWIEKMLHRKKGGDNPQP